MDSRFLANVTSASGAARIQKPDFPNMDRWRQAGLVVREAVLDDLDAIAKLERDAFPVVQVSRRSLRAVRRARHRPVIAATIVGAIAG